jgi:hypothetical protein
MSDALSNDKRLDERSGAERCWIWRDSYHYPQVAFSKPDPKVRPSVEYMRVLSRDEVEKLAYSESGVDSMQLINSLHRTIDGQRREINRMRTEIEKYKAWAASCEPLSALREVE